ncbi:MAG: DMT family transporter, partial [Holosporaceae bacterium]|nr:DMT family transporter [Holosporaceae bacterium]
MISDNSGPIMGIDAEKIGYLSVVTGVFLYAFSDALMKYFIPIYGVHQVVLLRTIFRIIPVVICAFFCRINPLKTSRLTENAVRALLATTSTYCFMAAYKFSPMTEVIVVAYTTAIFVIPLSILILKEKFSIPNTSAVLLGFSGMALAFRPGIGIYQWGVIFAAISALMSAMNAVIVKRLSSTESGITIIFYHLVCLLIFSLAIGFDSFTWISGGH